MIFGHIFVNMIFGTGPLSSTFSHTPALRPPHAHTNSFKSLHIVVQHYFTLKLCVFIVTDSIYGHLLISPAFYGKWI